MFLPNKAVPIFVILRRLEKAFMIAKIEIYKRNFIKKHIEWRKSNDEGTII